MNRQGDLFMSKLGSRLIKAAREGRAIARGEVDQYPNRPGFKQHGGTSQDAAEAIEPRADTLRGKALAVIKTAGPRGLTADEAADIMDRSVLSIRPRISELLELGLIERNGQRRKNSSGLFADAYRLAT